MRILTAAFCCSALAILSASADDSIYGPGGFRAPPETCREAVKGFLWLEAEGFADYGNWKIDTQFTHKMGSAYLIAQGVLKPIGEARTTVAVPRAGTWRAWVRTKDWLPEHSPGTFALSVGGRRSGTLGASKKAGWRWENAGEYELRAGACEVALVDLSGSFARCDAVLLTTDRGYVPPDDGEDLAAARLRFTGVDPTIADGGAYDVVVVGAGPGGIGASIAAARHGARTLLVHDRPMLGGNSSAEFRVSPGGAGNNHFRGLVNSREGGLCEEVRIGRARHWPKWGLDLVYRELVDAEPLIVERDNARVMSVERHREAITAVVARDTLTGRRTRYRGRIFVDCTGDGWVGVFAGAKRLYGREARSEYGEELAPETRDCLTMSGCIDDYRYRATDAEQPYETPAWADVIPAGFSRRVTSINAPWWLEHPGTVDDLEDPEGARDELVRISFGYWGWLRKHPALGAQARRSELTEVSRHNGRREGYRLLGDYVLNENDIEAGRMFPDRIAYGGWHLDTHDPRGMTNPGGDGFWKPVRWIPVYSIPYRCLYSTNVPNLFMAGRNISVSHIALGSTRIEGTILSLGQVAGTAAAMAIEKNLTPRAIGRTCIAELQQRLIKDDLYLPGLRNEDPADRARAAKVSASSVGTRYEYGPADPDFRALGNWWNCEELARGDVTAGVPRGALDRLEKVSCLLRSLSGSDAEVTLDVLESDSSVPPTADSSPLATARATLKAGGREFVDFAFARPVPLGKKMLWLRMRKMSDVCWTYRKHVYPEGGCLARFGRDGKAETIDWQQMAFVTVPHRTGPVDTRPEYVIDGVSRQPLYPGEGSCTHGWRSDCTQSLPQWLRLDFDAPVDAGEVRIVFDTEMTFDCPEYPAPWMLAKSYVLEALVDGTWKEIARGEENRRRLAVHRFPRIRASAFRITVTATWGSPDARIQEVRVY